MILMILLLGTGCASLWDAPANILGFSRRDIQEARKDATYQMYAAERGDVYAAVLEVATEAKYDIFLQDEVRGVVVVMGIPGLVNTTEVGIFLSSARNSPGVKVEIASRSTPAQRAVGQVLFSALREKFSQP
ncbi:MAG: hypothetical protein GX606_06925 [Elusimicrobia bacterium]|nr:hypothetical protein [Elusimicrobiota bacterium]